MAAHRAPSPEQALAGFSPGLPFAVALSGGADSTALLLACARSWPGQVRAVHIHHGLQAAADGFEAHCQALCLALGVPLAVRRVQAGHAPGQSPEDAARQARYAALAQAVQTEWPGVRDVALAQHADDQIETLLLALSRGAGLPGLASMPAHWQRHGLAWHRPWLTVPGAVLREWLQSQGQTWVEDPTNTDEKFTRNRIRARVLPALAEALPAFRETFARSATHAAQAQEVLNEVAAQDLAQVGVPPRIQALQQLSRARQALVLRHWLRLHHATTPSAAQLNELLDQVAACTTRGHLLHLKVGQGFVERDGPSLSFLGA
jgi:tRNA(Ile)-lysidine synthase